eukprot:scaffold3249_cov17-Tisochrysis_lutea.AAC.2
MGGLLAGPKRQRSPLELRPVDVQQEGRHSDGGVQVSSDLWAGKMRVSGPAWLTFEDSLPSWTCSHASSKTPRNPAAQAHLQEFPAELKCDVCILPLVAAAVRSFHQHTQIGLLIQHFCGCSQHAHMTGWGGHP